MTLEYMLILDEMNSFSAAINEIRNLQAGFVLTTAFVNDNLQVGAVSMYLTP